MPKPITLSEESTGPDTTNIMLVSRAKRYLYNRIKDQLAQLGFIKVESDLEFLFTSSGGLYLYQQGIITRLLRGNYFGITRLPDDQFIAMKYVQNGTRDERSTAELFYLSGKLVVNSSPFEFRDQDDRLRVPVRVHQILFHEGFIWLTNTRQNLIWKCDLTGKIVKEWCYTESFDYDPDTTSTDAVRTKARASANYHHFNSITFHKEHMYLLAHNSAGLDKSKDSFYLKLDHDFNIVDRVEGVGNACHNLVECDDDFYICDSGNARIVHPKYPDVHLGYFARGMIKVNNCLIVGGTTITDAPEMRGRGDSRIFFVPVGASKPIQSFSLGRTGDIHDIMLLER
ncbi:hypothetical protein Q6D67_21425 [Haliea sp. E1-2-M8]|uniref:hypothetical protein n=1 Tax=Haliea sp. E1-2-M8 TaxID=3064706 RepID=UPI0027256DD5|nr:hypothetical protein [Haliea sp. E1-2-M8]MDO8864237.1 hypothetical protein [Haliea sp. E1-2-M8]